MRLATSSCCSCNPGCQERRSITHALLPAALPMRFLTAGCKPAKQERHTKSTNVRAALTMETIPRYSEHARFFYLCYMQSTSRYSSAHFSGLIFQKCSDALILLKFWSANRALATVLCTFCRQLSQIEPRTRGNTWATPGATLPKKDRFRARESSHPWTHTLPNCYTSQLLDDEWLTWWCGWDDDGVDMMMWLTWWWEC